MAADSGPVELVTASARGALFAFLGPEPLRSLEATSYEVVSSGPRSVEFQAKHDGVIVTRHLELDDAGYGGRMIVSIRNDGTAALLPKLDVVLYGQERPVAAPDHFLNYSLVASVDGTVHRSPVAGIGTAGFLGGLLGRAAPTGTSYAAPVEWVGVESQYFLLAAVSETPRDSSGFSRTAGSRPGPVRIRSSGLRGASGHGSRAQLPLVLRAEGARDRELVDPRLESSINAGWALVRPLVHIFEAMLRWTHDHVIANYGVAIILMTVLVRVADVSPDAALHEVDEALQRRSRRR